MASQENYHAALASAMRRQVLDALNSTNEPQDASAVAELLKVHVTTARFHLDQLEAAGLVKRQSGAEKRRGRPRVLYRPSGPARDEGARAQLIEVLATALADRGNRAETLSVEAGRRWADLLDTAAADPEAELLRVLDELGFEPEPSGNEIRLHACPFRDAAREHPNVVCSVHRGLIDELLDRSGAASRAQLIPFVEPELCLVSLSSR